jgi:ubiquinone/menaquinone biosynthesis C-methylase UbiE
MARAAKTRVSRGGCPRVWVGAGRSEALPCRDQSFDRVLSNGVLNLSPDKRRTFFELFRVLRPGGLLLFADIVRAGPGPQASGPQAWSS